MTDGLFDVRGATVLVTGGSRGIGLFIARGFVQGGARVFISARNADDCNAAAEELAKLGRCESLPADLSTMAGVDRLVADVGARCESLEVLVNNAGATHGAPLDAYPEEHWDPVFDVNLKAPFFLTQRLLPLLRKHATVEKPGRVINIGSIAGLNPMGRNSFAYHASKAALHHMTKHVARHAAPLVTVNAIAPGAFETRMITFALQNRPALEAMVPRALVGQQDDIAGVAIFLSSRAGAYVTGAVIPVDGGMALRNP